MDMNKNTDNVIDHKPAWRNHICVVSLASRAEPAAPETKDTPRWPKTDVDWLITPPPPSPKSTEDLRCLNTSYILLLFAVV